MLPVAAFTDWLVGVSGGLVFFATLGLGVIAVLQMKQLSRQAEADSENVRAQIAASVEMGEAIKEAARAELQPMVFARPTGSIVHGRRSLESVAADYGVGINEIGITYAIANEGTGLAVNVRHGVTVGEVRREYGGGMHFVTLRAGEVVPPPNHHMLLVPFTVPEEVSEDWLSAGAAYWAEFENVFGEHFRTVVSADPLKPAEFTRLD